MVHVHGRRRVGATMPPEGKDNLKGQACLGCKRNSNFTKRYSPALHTHITFDVSIVVGPLRIACGDMKWTQKSMSLRRETFRVG
jgi:hypothetical protein